METVYYYFCIALLIHFLMPFSAMGATKNITTDQTALLALKATISDSNQILAMNWSAATSPCNWIGVACSSRHNRVTSLNISRMALSGRIPPQLGNLSFLVSLDLSFNNFEGCLPKDLAHLRRLRFLSFYVNKFTGEVPSYFGSLPNLQFLKLRNNSFTGSLPTSLSNASKLESLDLSFNSIEGMIPEEFGDFLSLKILYVQFNKLTGPLPSAIFNITTLENMGFTSNSLSGILPADICSHLPNLNGLLLSSNELDGRIPPNLSNCSSLQRLSLSYNHFFGSVPRDIGKLENLQILYLGENNLNGELPEEIGDLHNLIEIAIEQNNISGLIPLSIFNISSLQGLYVTGNKLYGTIQREIGKLALLQKLYLGDNRFTGELPEEIGDLHNLIVIGIEDNNISGLIPLSIFNISSLQILNLLDNKLSGTIPREIGRWALLQELYLGRNRFTGVIPEQITNLSRLEEVDLGKNNLIGQIPIGIFNISSLRIVQFAYNHLSGNLPSSMGYGLPNLEFFNIASNNLSAIDSSSTSDSSQLPELSFFTSLKNCKSLSTFEVSTNPLNGVLPNSIGLFSSSLETLFANGCGIKGSIPEEIGNLSGLVDLDLSNNELTGMIAPTIQGLQNIQRLWFGNNKLTGSIPSSFCKLRNIGLLNLMNNLLSCSIPKCFENITTFRYIYLQENTLNSSVPRGMWKLHDLFVLNLSSNSFSGSLPPEITNLRALTWLDLSMNNFSGTIPSTIGSLQQLLYLSLRHNKLQGLIPESIGSVLSLETLDLSQNNLSGSIPKSLEALKYLTYFNVSLNDLSGEIPSEGPFKNFTSQSFLSNGALCGSPKFHVSICTGTSNHKSRKQKVIRIVLFTLLGVVAFVLSLTITFLLFRRQKKNSANHDDQFQVIQVMRLSYYELRQATEGYSEANLIGKGSFGSVYKGILNNGASIAVKVFNLHLEEVAFKSFDRECEVLRNLRHRNLTKILSSCSNNDFKALVLEYMPNGSLEQWLHSEDHSLDMMKRLNTMIDVSSALEYLHNGYLVPVVHCDLKPSNILFDEDMVAHVNDFGLARLLGDDGNSFARTKTLATFGYMAPEYGTDGLVSPKSDVYSFGILVMETFSRRKPSDKRFDGDISLKQLVTDCLPNSIIQVVDTNLLTPEDEYFVEKLWFVKSIMELALCCCSDSPGERIHIRHAMIALKNMKLQLSKFVVEK